jgi:hypothetical protein
MTATMNNGPALTGLADQINAAHDACQRHLKSGLKHAKHAGELLLQAKNKVPHGQWLSWLKRNCKFTQRTAQRYLLICKHWPELTAKATRASHLSFREAIKAIATPKGDRWDESAERLEALREAVSPQLRPVIAANARFDVVETAAQTGWLTDGKFAVKLNSAEREKISCLAGFSREKPAPVERIIVAPCAGDLELQVIGQRIRDYGPAHILLGNKDADKYVTVLAEQFEKVRASYTALRIMLNKDSLVRFFRGDECVGVIASQGNSIDFAAMQKECLDKLDQFRQTFEWCLKHVHELNPRDTAKVLAQLVVFEFHWPNPHRHPKSQAEVTESAKAVASC